MRSTAHHLVLALSLTGALLPSCGGDDGAADSTAAGGPTAGANGAGGSSSVGGSSAGSAGAAGHTSAGAGGTGAGGAGGIGAAGAGGTGGGGAGGPGAGGAGGTKVAGAGGAGAAGAAGTGSPGGAGMGPGGASGSAGSSGTGGSAALPDCPQFADGVSGGNVASDALTEVSGIAASRKNPGVFWVHNDSGGGVKVYAIDATGKDLGTFPIAGASGGDTEDIAVGAGPDPAKTYVFLGDIGDNSASRASIRIFRFEEPTVSLDGSPATTDVSADLLTLTYPDGPHNAEALLVDPISKDGFIVTKNSGDAKVFRFAASTFTDGSSAVPELLTTVSAGVVSSADFSPDGSLVILKTDQIGHLWRRPLGGSLADALATLPCDIKTKTEPNGEALGWAADGSGYYTTSEELHQPVWFFKLLP